MPKITPKFRNEDKILRRLELTHARKARHANRSNLRRVKLLSLSYEATCKGA